VCPNMLEQNGVAEHKHRHIVETGLTLQVESNLPISFWAHAFTTVVYPINKLPTPIFNGSTLYFKVYYKSLVVHATPFTPNLHIQSWISKILVAYSWGIAPLIKAISALIRPVGTSL